MQTKQLGNSDLHITPIGFGAWVLGGSGWQFGWGGQNDHDLIAAIYEALDHGINWIDTAAVYGLGHSEKVVAWALQGVNVRPYVFTKCGMTWDEHCRIHRQLTAESIRRECEASLRRLNVERIDLYQIHWPDPDQEIEEGWTEMAKLKDEGKVRWIGVSNFDVSQMQRAEKIASITSLQPPYSLINRRVEAEVLPFTAQHQIGNIAYSPMGSGILSGSMTRDRLDKLPSHDWRRSSPNFQEPLFSQHLRLVTALRKIGSDHGCAPGAVAIACVLRNPAITGAIVGARCAGQIAEIVSGASLRLSPSEIKSIEQLLNGESQEAPTIARRSLNPTNERASA